MGRNPVGVASTRAPQFTVASRAGAPRCYSLRDARFVRLGAMPKRLRYSSAKVVELWKPQRAAISATERLAALERAMRVIQPQVAHVRHRRDAAQVGKGLLQRSRAHPAVLRELRDRERLAEMLQRRTDRRA